MRILVFGAGVLGSYLAHALVRGGNDITVLARGKRAEELNNDGVVVRHYFQRKAIGYTVTPVNQMNLIRKHKHIAYFALKLFKLYPFPK
ncbi:ketopantoate reductase [Paenibacillus wynnii]|nr:ketopantoate reductase [Paenibacillus wynnii]